VSNVNKQTLCGAENWRLPTSDELKNLIYCSDGTYNTLIKNEFGLVCTNFKSIISPTINITYFPNTQSNVFWSSSPSVRLIGGASNVYFDSGSVSDANKSWNYFVRLVHDIKPLTSSAYTKISNTGATLPDTAVLGSGPNDWACTKDNKTGLIWEVKTDDGGLRDNNKTYTNFFVGETGYGEITNADFFVQSVNKQYLCGKNNWRLPSIEEGMTLMVCSDNEYYILNNDSIGNLCKNPDKVSHPTLNQYYFPNTRSTRPHDSYWTSWNTNNWSAGVIGFYYGGSYLYGIKTDLLNVLLVSGTTISP
jgi:hypothetical protein